MNNIHGNELAKHIKPIIDQQVQEWVSTSSALGTRRNFSADQLEDIAFLAQDIAILVVMEYDRLVHNCDK